MPTDTVLSWTAGKFAATHDVYLGTVADVKAATRTKPMDILVSQGQTATSFSPTARLDFGQTYYWRVDEVNAAARQHDLQGRGVVLHRRALRLSDQAGDRHRLQRPAQHGPGEHDQRLRPHGRPARHRRAHDVAHHRRPAELDSVPVRQGLQAVRSEGVEFQPGDRGLHRFRRQEGHDRILRRRHDLDGLGQCARVRSGDRPARLRRQHHRRSRRHHGQVRQADDQRHLGRHEQRHRSERSAVLLCPGAGPSAAAGDRRDRRCGRCQPDLAAGPRGRLATGVLWHRPGRRGQWNRCRQDRGRSQLHPRLSELRHGLLLEGR